METTKKLPPGFLESSDHDLLLFNKDPYQFVEDLKSQYGMYLR
jgi:hypothetical protein